MRLFFSLVILVMGVWLFHSTSVYQGILAARGQGDWSLLTGDLPFMLRFVGALLLVVGAAFSFGSKWIGFVPALLGAACYVLLTVAMIAMGADISLWQDDAILTVVLILFTAGLFSSKGR